MEWLTRVSFMYISYMRVNFDHMMVSIGVRVFSSSAFLVLLLFGSLFASEKSLDDASEKTADSVHLHDVMDLFVQNPHIATPQDSLKVKSVTGYVDTSAHFDWPLGFETGSQKERNESKQFRAAIAKALDEERYDDLKMIMKDVETYERTAQIYPVFYANDKLVIQYFLKNFDYLSHVDSIKVVPEFGFYNDEFQGILYGKLRKHIELGTLDSNLKKVENESDRTFIYIILNSLFVPKEHVSSMIEKYKYQLTDEQQLFFLVKHFWHKEDYDSKNYGAFSWGGAVIKSFGRLSDKIGLSPGMYLGIDFVRKDFLYEWFMDINGCQNKEQDSLQFYDMRWDFNFGYTFLKKDHLNLFGYVTAGFGLNGLSARGKNSNDKANKDLPTQFSPAFGAGVMVDVFFTEKDHVHHGLRFRTGVRSLFSGDVLRTSGVRLYASLEWTFREYTKKPVDFDFSFREKGVK